MEQITFTASDLIVCIAKTGFTVPSLETAQRFLNNQNMHYYREQAAKDSPDLKATQSKFQKLLLERYIDVAEDFNDYIEKMNQSLEYMEEDTLKALLNQGDTSDTNPVVAIRNHINELRAILNGLSINDSSLSI